MGKAFAILLIVVGIWVGLEVYTEGVDGAFGGHLAFLTPAASPSASPETARPWAGERAGDALHSAHSRRMGRIEEQTEPR